MQLRLESLVTPPSQPGIDLERAAHREPVLDHRPIGTNEKRQRTEKPWRDASERSSFSNRLARPSKMSRRQRPKAAMRGLLMIERGAAAKVTRFDQGHAQTTTGRFVGAGKSVNASADDQHVVEVAVESREITLPQRYD